MQGFYPTNLPKEYQGILIYSYGVNDPTVFATPGSQGQLYLKLPEGDLYRKLDNGSTTNWLNITNGGSLNPSQPDQFSTSSSDFIDNIGNLSTFNAGAGSSSQTGTYGQNNSFNAMGVVESDTGTTATGRSGLGGVSVNALATTRARYLYKARQALPILSDNVNSFVFYSGLGNFYSVAGDGVNGLFFRYNHNVNGGRYECVSLESSGILTVIDSGVLADIDYHIFEVRLEEAGSPASFYIDNVLVAQINNPVLIPSPLNSFSFGWKIQKLVGLTVRSMATDWYYFELQRSAAR